MSDPFGRNDRTIIMPDPGGRRSAPGPAPAPAAPAAPSSQPAFARPGYDTRGSASAGGQTGGGHSDDWVMSDQRPAAPPPPPNPGDRGRALVLKRDVVVAANENPFLRAAGPLLLLLGRLRVQLSQASASNLMEQVAAAIDDFEKDSRQAGVSAEQTNTAKYIVCATADDIVQNIPTDERHVWTQYSMLARFFGQRIGGVRFFEELDKAKVDPSGNYYLLELMHACLALGFQGIHRTSAGGAANLQQIQRNLYELLRRTRQANREVSPRWQGQAIAAAISRFKAPLWAIASVVGVLLLGLYIVLRFLLSGDAEAAATAMVTVHPNTQIGIQRRVFTPPPPPPPPAPESPLGKIRTALAAEIPARVSLSENGNQIVIRLVAAMFKPGDAAVEKEFEGLMTKISGLLDKTSGPIKVVGHTDSSPIKTVRFPSNFALSQERAKAVANLVKTGLSQPNRVDVEGKGSDVPIAPNTSPDGRAKNRRVEILIQRNQ